MRRAEGGAKNFGVFRVKNHDFTAKNLIFFRLRREARKFLRYSVWKITILRQKIIFFSNFRGARAGCAPPPWIRPCITCSEESNIGAKYCSSKCRWFYNEGNIGGSRRKIHHITEKLVIFFLWITSKTFFSEKKAPGFPWKHLMWVKFPVKTLPTWKALIDWLVYFFDMTKNNASEFIEIFSKRFVVQYSQRHIMINHCDRHITHLGDTDTVQSETYHDKSLW